MDSFETRIVRIPDDLEEQLTARCAAALPRAHRPSEIRIVEALQQGPTGKTLLPLSVL